jgi:signal peptidase I
VAPRRTGQARRHQARRFARETRRLAVRHRRRIGEESCDAIEEAALELEVAAQSDDAERLSAALARLDGLWEKHLSFTRFGFWRDALLLVLASFLAALMVRALVLEPFRIPTGSMAPTLLPGDHIFVNKLAYGVRLSFLDRWLFQIAPPRRGDVVVFANPRDRGKDFVKRVVGLPGDKIEVRDQVLYVNDVPQPRAERGKLSYPDYSEETRRWIADTCPLFEEELARGPVLPPATDRPADLDAGWRAAALSGVLRHSVLQCGSLLSADRQGPFQVAAGNLFVLGDNRDRSADSRSDGGWQVPLGNVKGRVAVVLWSWGKGGWALFGDRGFRIERLFKRIE